MLTSKAAGGGLVCRPPVNRPSVACFRPAQRSVRALAAKVTGKPVPTSAKQAVEDGLAAFNDRKDYAEALRLFKAAMDLKPSEEEAIAALYNAGCAHAKRKEWAEAANVILSAVNDYNLKISVALQVRCVACRWVGTGAASACALLLLPPFLLCEPQALTAPPTSAQNRTRTCVSFVIRASGWI